MLEHRTPAIVVVALLVAASIGYAAIESRDGALASFTGAPAVAGKAGELHCGICHFPMDWNNLDTPGGGVQIVGLPPAYAAGDTYPIEVHVTSDSTAAFENRTWGFELTAIRASDGEGSGTFLPGDPDTLQVIPGEGGEFASRWYATHTGAGRRDGLGGTIVWTLAWRAPDVSEGVIQFHAAAVAGNGDGELTGDFVYRTTVSAADATTPASPTTWGALKRRYR